MIRHILTLILVITFFLPGIAETPAMKEVNLQRQNFELPPLREDLMLSRFAFIRVKYIATHENQYWNHGSFTAHKNRYLPNERFLVEGLGPPKGFNNEWCTCVMRAVGDLEAGAAAVWSRGGRRYMCLIVRAKSTRDGGKRIPVTSTIHLNPNTPRIGDDYMKLVPTYGTQSSNAWRQRF